MAVTTPKFNYINGTKVINNAQGEIFGLDVKKGQQPVVSPAVNASGSTLGHINVRGVEEKVDISIGKSKETKGYAFAKEDVVLAPASGMTVTGVLTYGDGQITNTNVYPADDESVKKGHFEFGRPSGPITYDYSKLST